MKLEKALRLIEEAEVQKPDGYRVCFEQRRDSGRLDSDSFPERQDAEDLIGTEEEAWELARRFANALIGRVVNVYVTDAYHHPVPGYYDRRLNVNIP